MEKCIVCQKEYNDFDPASYPPTCCEPCRRLWITWVDHRDEPCWIPGCLEVYCGTRTPGYCSECDVFKIEQEIKRRDLNKNTLTGNY